MAAIVGTGATITLGTSGFTLDVLSLELSLDKSEYETTHFGTTGGRTYANGTLLNATLDIEHHVVPTDGLPFAADETLLLTFSNGDKWQWAAAHCNAASINLPLEDRATARSTWRLSGAFSEPV